MSCSLNIQFQEHIRYIRNNNPQSAYALHILQNQHEYGQMNNIMTLLKSLNNPSLLIPFEQYYIQSLHRKGKLIPEQNPVSLILLQSVTYCFTVSHILVQSQSIYLFIQSHNAVQSVTYCFRVNPYSFAVRHKLLYSQSHIALESINRVLVSHILLYSQSYIALDSINIA